MLEKYVNESVLYCTGCTVHRAIVQLIYKIKNETTYKNDAHFDVPPAIALQINHFIVSFALHQIFF